MTFGLQISSGASLYDFDLGKEMFVIARGGVNASNYRGTVSVSPSVANQSNSDLFVRPLNQNTLFSIEWDGEGGHRIYSEIKSGVSVEYLLFTAQDAGISNGHGLVIYDAQGIEKVGTYTNTIHIDVISTVQKPVYTNAGNTLLAIIPLPITPVGATRYFKANGHLIIVELSSGGFYYKVIGNQLYVYWSANDSFNNSAISAPTYNNVIISGYVFL